MAPRFNNDTYITASGLTFRKCAGAPAVEPFSASNEVTVLDMPTPRRKFPKGADVMGATPPSLCASVSEKYIYRAVFFRNGISGFLLSAEKVIGF